MALKIYDPHHPVDYSAMKMRVEYETIGVGIIRPRYIGYAVPGTDEGTPLWQIFRVNYDSNGNAISNDFAQRTLDSIEDNNFVHQWSNVLSLDYGP